MPQHAKGSFSVDINALTPAPAPGLGRFSINKIIQGDLEGSSIGEMFSGGNPQSGLAGYVAMEQVSGSLGGKAGGFALQHNATMDQSGYNLSVIIVPGSGTGELQGISGVFTIIIEGNQHRYDLEYQFDR